MTAQPSLLDILTPTRPTSSRGPVSSWLLGHLIAGGHVTETGASRRARIRTCPGCQAHVLVGLDGETCAVEAIVDPTPLTALGEALARLEDRWTWALRREGDRYVLDPRDHRNIEHTPAGTRRREDVLREHRCHTAPPADALAATTSFAEAAAHATALPAGSPAPF